MSKPAESTQNNIEALNNKLAQELRKKTMISEDILKISLEDCNQNKTNLGQSLVQKRYLSMSDLVQMMKNIVYAPLNEESTKEKDKETGIVGSEFAGHEIIHEIARGGMGIVYKAYQKDVKRIVALKVLLGGNTSDPQQIRRFFREAKATASLVHPHIIPIYNIGEHQSYHYFTMKYIDGGTFEKWIASDMPLMDKISVVTKIAYALHHAHEKNILHRDIKPSNILLDQENQPYLTDFGLAKFIDSTSLLTQTGTALGTPFYMSPEQVQGQKRKIGRQSDIYSLGVVLYQVLTTSLPFTAETITELYRKIVEEEPIWPANLPEGLLCICQKAMEKSPELRYSKAEDMAKDLEQFCAGGSVMAKKFHFKSYFLRFIRKHRKRLLKIASVYVPLATLAFLLVYGLYFFQEQRSQEANKRRIEEQKIFSECKKLSEKGQYQESLGILIANQEKIDQSAFFYLEMASLYRHLDRFDESQLYLEKAENLMDDKKEILYHRSLLSYEIGNYQEACQQIESYLQHEEKQTADAYYHKGKVLNKLGKKEEATQSIEIARNKQKIHTKEWIEKIEEHLQKQETTQALSYLEMLLQKYPLCEKAYLIRSQIYFSMGENDKAIADISAMAEYNPGFSSFMLKAQWLEKAGSASEARDTYKKAWEEALNEKDRFLALKALGDIEFHLKNYEQSMACYEEINRKGNADKEILFKIAKTAFYRQDYPLVKKYLEDLKSDLPDSLKSQLLYYKGVILYKEKQDENAIACLEEAISLGSLYQENIYTILGEIYFSQKKFSKALEYLKKSHKTSSENIHAQWLLGNAAMECQDFNQAIESFSLCITLEPWKAIYYHKRGRGYAALEKFDKAEQDFFKCQQLEPDFLEPILDISQIAFKQQILHKLVDLRIVLGKYHYAFDPKSIDLFSQDVQLLQSEYIQKALLLKQEIRSRKRWDTKKAEISIRGLIENDSPSVHKIVNNSLLSMYYEPEVHFLLEKEIQNKSYKNAVIQRLNNIYERIRQKYFEEQQIFLFACLVRYYSAKDQEGIKEIHAMGSNAIACLCHILENANAPMMMRFLSARMLCDLKDPQGYVSLHECKKNDDPVVKLFCHCILLQQNKNSETMAFFRQLPTFNHPYARAVAAKYMPIEYASTLKNVFLKDEDQNVRLIAASRLRWSEDKEAKEEIIKALSSPSSDKRLYAHASFWNFDPIENKKSASHQKMLEYFPLLVDAVKDENIEIRRIALFQLAKFENSKSLEILNRHLKEENGSMRLQAIISLSHILAIDSILPIVKDPNEPLIFRLAVLLGASNNIKKDPTSMLLVANNLFKDPDERMRIIVFAILGRWGKKFGTQFILNYLQSPDPYTRFGAVCGIISGDKPEGINSIVKFLKDPDFRVRSATAMCLISILAKQDRKKVDLIHEKIRGEDAEFLKTAALGYSKPLHDAVNFSPQENIKWDWHKVQMQFFDEIVETLQNWQTDPLKPALTSPEIFYDYLSKAMELDPKNPRYYFERGLVSFSQKKYEKSLIDIQKASDYNKDSPSYQFWLAKLHYYNKNYDESEKILQSFLKDFPWHYEANTIQMEIFKAKNQKEETLQMQNKLVLLKTLKPTQ